MDNDRLTMLQDRVDYWREVCEPLGLGHWRISVEIVDEPHGHSGSGAAVQPSEYYDSASIEFADVIFDTHTDTEIDEIIVHELMHIVMRDLFDALTEPQYMFGTPAWSAFRNRIDHETEGMIDRTARAIVAAHQEPWSDVVISDDTTSQEND